MFSIEVGNPIFKDAKLGKHVTYQVTGNDYKGEFQCTRRYKEFNALRKALQKRWPGLLVPSIPEKQMIV